MAGRGINKVILIGNLGADPDFRSTPSGTSVATLSLATTENWKDPQSGEFRENTEWHRVKLFSRRAEVARDYLKKGSKVYIEGRLQTRKWQDKDGTDRYTTEIIANDMQMLDSRGGGTADFARDHSAYASGPSTQPQQPAPRSEGPPDDFDDDDVPF